MEQKKNISDELLARYLCGKVSDSEREEVLAHMGESDENLAELIEISTAIEEQQEREKVAAPNSEPQVIKINPRHKVQTRYIWAAAAMVLIFAAGGAVMWRVSRSPQGRDEVIVADNHNLKKTIKDSQNGTPKETGSKEKNIVTKDDGYPLQIDYQHTASNAVASGPMLVIIKPSQQTTEVRRDDKLPFEWRCDAAKTELVIYDNNDYEIIRQDLTGRSNYILNVSHITCQNHLKWEIIATSKNSSITKKIGIIKIIK